MRWRLGNFRESHGEEPKQAFGVLWTQGSSQVWEAYDWCWALQEQHGSGDSTVGATLAEHAKLWGRVLQYLLVQAMLEAEE